MFPSICHSSTHEAFLSPFVSTPRSINGFDVEDPQLSQDSKRNVSSLQNINQSLSSSLSFPRMLVNTYSPPSLNETNDDILSPNFSQDSSSTNSPKEINQTSDDSSQSFHTLNSKFDSDSLKDNDLCISSSHSVSSLSSCKETAINSSIVPINLPNSETPTNQLNQTSDSLSSVDYFICSKVANSLKDSVAHACSKYHQKSEIPPDKNKSAKSLSPLSSSLVPCDTHLSEDKSKQKIRRLNLKRI